LYRQGGPYSHCGEDTNLLLHQLSYPSSLEHLKRWKFSEACGVNRYTQKYEAWCDLLPHQVLGPKACCSSSSLVLPSFLGHLWLLISWSGWSIICLGTLVFSHALHIVFPVLSVFVNSVIQLSTSSFLLNTIFNFMSSCYSSHILKNHNPAACHLLLFVDVMTYSSQPYKPLLTLTALCSFIWVSILVLFFKVVSFNSVIYIYFSHILNIRCQNN
jgi:hypothetical protein